MVPFTLMTPYSYPMGHNSHLLVTQNSKKRLKFFFFFDVYLHKKPLLCTQTCLYTHANEWCLLTLCYHSWCPLHSRSHMYSWPLINRKLLKISFFAIFTSIISHTPNLTLTLFHGSMNDVQLSYDITHGALYSLAPYRYSMGQDSHYPWLKLPRICWKYLFISIFNAITFCSTQYIDFWAYECCPLILWYHAMCFWHLWPHIVTLQAIIGTYLWQKKSQKPLKNILLVVFTSRTSYATPDFFCRPMKCVYLSYDITHCTVYTHDPM
jgi:hypothetical protein